MNPFKRVSSYIIVLTCLGICILFSGCGNVQQWEAERIASSSRLAPAPAPVPGPGKGSESAGVLGSVHGVLKNKDTGAPVKDATIPLLKVKSVEGGKVNVELGFSADGKMIGGLSTKTDGVGAFRFEKVAKGTPYVLGAVDQSGKNVVVILTANDNVQDLGVVYQKKQSDKKKP